MMDSQIASQQKAIGHILTMRPLHISETSNVDNMTSPESLVLTMRCILPCESPLHRFLIRNPYVSPWHRPLSKFNTTQHILEPKQTESSQV
jgi:hypothetical protein